MWWIVYKLKQAGYTPYLFGYNSRTAPIASHTEQLQKFIDSHGLSKAKISFVTHSLGSIVLRSFLAKYPESIIPYRAVNLGPPHLGSKTARKLGQLSIFKKILGPSFVELFNIDYPTTTEQIELGVIAGTVPLKKGYYHTLDGPNDGVVEVSETKIEGLADHLVLPAGHSTMVFQPKVIAAIIQFLNTGKF